ncbi:amino acid adenylation domain-containing protein [Nocardia tengchongensis]|uniref:non-ribosomal peptide synthetase n=1 Tax=Nocardia tengchongensis TaxID=2055889 RepID=UPI00367FBE2A
MRAHPRQPSSRSPRRRDNGTGGPTLATLLAAAVERNPDHIALISDDTQISYRALDARSNTLARRLCAQGIGPEDLVALAIPRSIDSITALWAIAKTGAAFVPLDPTTPHARLDYQITDSRCLYGLTHQRHLSELPNHIPWLAVDDPHTHAELSELSPAPISYLDRRGPVRPTNLAYLIYTSGSTGQPKPVAVTHNGLAALCTELRATVAVPHTARTLHFASPTFDASILELLLAIGSAATMVIAAPTILGGSDLATFLHRNDVTHAFLTPSVLATLHPAGLPALTTIVVGGEACPPTLVDQWADGRRHLHNAYGPTESTIAATLTTPLRPRTTVTIGRPIEGIGYRILDPQLRPTALGATGELYLTGAAIARGYPRHLETTATRFVADPFTTTGQRMYRTGDLVRRTHAGELEYLGRCDHQVKIRGHRIELGEIDTTLARLPDITAAVTVERRTATGDIELVSFVRPHPATTPDPATLRAALTTRLPAYMRPTSITVIDSFPLTPTGKIDRAALRALPTTQAPQSQRTTGIGEDLITEAFAHVLGHQRFSADSDFFAVGGNSLLATQAAARLSEIWNLRIPVQLLFDHPSVASLTTAIRSQQFDTARPPLMAGVRPERIPLSANQLRFWLRNQFDTTAAVDNLGFALRLPGIDLDALQHALTDLVTRHEALRTRYPADEAGPHQLIIDPAAAGDCFSVLDVPADTVDDHIHRILRQGFDVTTQVPLRVRLLRTPEENILVCAMHHICADGSSMAPLAGDLAQAYTARHNNATPTWVPLPVQYTDFALWQHQLLGSRNDPTSLLSQQLRYWTEELAGLPDQLDLPTDHRRPTVASLRGATVDDTLTPTMHTALLGLARHSQVSLFMLMRTALAVLLARLSNTSDIAIGVPMTQRGEPALEGVVGMFVNTTVSRTHVDLAEPFTTLLARSRTRDLANFAHAEVPFEHVVDAIDPVRSPGRHPLYQVGFAFQNFTHAELDLTDTAPTMVDVETDTVKSDLHIGVIDIRDREGAPGPIAIRFGYSTDLFDRATVQRYLRAYVQLLQSILDASDTPVGDLELIHPDDQHHHGHGHEQPIAREHLTAAVARHAATRPTDIAIVRGSHSITYGEFHDRVTRLARWLIADGIGPESIIAVAMRRSIDQVVAIYAVAEAGAAWVPIDPDHPRDRNNYILESAAPQRILTTTGDNYAAATHAIDAIDVSAYATGPVHERERITALHPDHPAYVIYTSGSTGRPKGVVITHAAIVNQIAWMHTHYNVSRRDTYLHKTAATFDVSLWGYFLPLAAGARLVLAEPGQERDPDAISRLLGSHHITLTDFVPTMLTVLTHAARPADLRSLRAVFVIGEALPPETAHAFAALSPAPLHNLYGPTEAAVSITAHPVRDTDHHEASVPIGTPIWNSGCQVLDARLHPVPVGVSGELMLTGDQLARGYHASPGLTATRFVANPHGAPGTRMYRSGDLACRRTDGTLDYQGRTDFQIKLRGHRIELGEIESALLTEPTVAQAVVLVRHTAGQDNLTSYVVPTPGTTIDPKSLRHQLSELLPAYMVPSAVLVVDHVPLNASGKLDRNALPDPVFISEDPLEPRTPLETAIAQIFRDILHLTDIGVHDDFFELGGSSLLVFTVHQRLSQHLGHHVPMSAILAAPTVAGLAAHIEGTPSPVAEHSPAMDAVLDPAITAAERTPQPAGAPQDILLTGATGFLGIHLLHEILTHTTAHVWCLVRAADPDSGIARIVETMTRFKLPTGQIAARVSVVCGDLSQPQLGLNQSDFDLLAHRVDAIIHNGARVNHIDPYQRLRATNVDATRWVLRLATTHRTKAVHYVSTLGTVVPAGTPPDSITEKDRLLPNQLQDNGYLTSKWVAEELIRQAGQRAIPVTIYRPGTICADTTTAVNNPDDAFWNMIRAAAILGAAPDIGHATVSLVPVDYVARAIITIATRPPRHTTYHLINHTPIAVHDILDCLTRHQRPVTTAPLDTVWEQLQNHSAARAETGDNALTRAALLAPTFTGLDRTTRYTDTNTQEALHDTPLRCPVVDEKVLDRYIEHFIATDFLPTPSEHEQTSHGLQPAS